MSRASSYRHEFVRSFPEPLGEGVLYISVEFGSAAHRCFCGCRHEVYTPLSPRDWMMIYDGETVSLDPSIGNWSFSCQSHYWLVRGQVTWDRPWSVKQVEQGRALDRIRKSREYRQTEPMVELPAKMAEKNLLSRIWSVLSGR